MPSIENLEPKLVWKHFDEIRKIPRCSKHEEKIREYIVNFAKKQGLKTRVDSVGNVVIIKPATPGMQNKPTIILQGHMDMVCEKNSDVKFDFSKDPIQLKITGDLLTANGTTLGADNGIGLAISLAILEDKKVQTWTDRITLHSRRRNRTNWCVCHEIRHAHRKNHAQS